MRYRQGMCACPLHHNAVTSSLVTADGALHVDCISGQGSRLRSSPCKECITSVYIPLCRHPPPCRLDPPRAQGKAPRQEKGEGASGSTTSFSFRAAQSLPPPPNPFCDCPICPSSVRITFGAQDSRGCKQRSQHTARSLRPHPLSCPVSIETGKQHGPQGSPLRPPNPSHSSPVTQDASTRNDS